MKYYLLTTLSLFFFSSVYSQAPEADFSAIKTNGCDKLRVDFKDKSTNNPTEWTWYFDDGSRPATIQDPVKAFYDPGKYTVTLVVSNAYGSDTVVKTGFIRVYESPESALSANPTTGCPPLTVDLTDETVTHDTTINSRFWDFGDGNTGTGAAPSHTYKNSGSYQVTLEVEDHFGCTDKSSITVINVSEKPEASYTSSYTRACTPPLTVQFTNTSTGSDLSYEWFFEGTPGSASEENPQHTFTENGTYDITLVATGDNGCSDTLTKKHLVQINTFNASISTNSDTTGCVPLTVNFIDSSSTVLSSWRWEFGDGTVDSVNQNATHTYDSAGIYTVRFIAVDTVGCQDTAVREEFIHVYDKPGVQFSSPTDHGCEVPVTVTFNDITPGSSQRQWFFPDDTLSPSGSDTSYTFTTNGSHTIGLHVTDTNGCSATRIDSNYFRIARPEAYFGANNNNGCKNLTTSFVDSSTSTGEITQWLWHFGDTMNSTDTVPDPVFTYTDTGTFDVTLIVKDANGCLDTLVRPNFVKVGMKPDTIAFALDTSIQCYSLPIEFTNHSSSYANRWEWDFDDGGIAREQDPIYMFPDTGTYPLTLKVGMYNCIDSVEYGDTIRILAPRANIPPTFACDTPATISFIDQSIGADSVIWIFDDTTRYDSTFTRDYTSLGRDIFTFIATNENGCADTLADEVVNISKIVPGFTQDKMFSCQFEDIIFTDTSQSLPDYSIVETDWDFGDGGNTDSINIRSVRHSYSVIDTFNISVTVRDNIGCETTYTTSNELTIHALPTPVLRMHDTVGCVPFDVTFTDSSYAAEPIIERQWSFVNTYAPEDTATYLFTDTSYTFTEHDTAHIFSEPGVYNIMLKITDSLTCSNTTTQTVTATMPSPAFIFDTLICYTQPANFYNTTSLHYDSIFDANDLLIRIDTTVTDTNLSYMWDFGDTSDNRYDTVQQHSRRRTAQHSYQVPATDTLSVRLYATDTNGCTTYASNPVVVSRPTPDFYGENFQGADSVVLNCYPQGIYFKDTSSSDVPDVDTARTWFFGDDMNTSTEVHPYNDYRQPGSFDVTLVTENKYGCVDTLTKKDYVIVLGPYAEFDFFPKNGCGPLDVTFIADSLYRVDSLRWAFGDYNSYDKKVDSITHTYTSGGEYIPFLQIIDSNGCKVDTTIGTVRVLQADVKFEVNADSSCDYNTFDFADISTIDYGTVSQKTWIFGDGDTVNADDPANNFFMEHYYDSSDAFDVTLQIHLDSCVFDTTKYDYIDVFKKYDLRYDMSDTSGCMPLNIQFTVDDSSYASEAASWSWTFDDGTDSVLTKNPVHTFDATGTYNIALDVTYTNHCQHHYEWPQNITVYDLPDANFSTAAQEVFAHEVVSFSNLSSGSSLSWHWDFGDGVTNTQQNPNHIFENTGTFDVMLVAATSHDCRDTASLELRVVEGYEIPNVFTPNGDGVNDMFRIPISGYVDYSLTIFNRWGQVLFYSEVKNAAWDGRTKSGEPVPEGTYYYLLKATSSNGEAHDKTGSVTLIRE